jgi:hypothetical protein
MKCFDCGKSEPPHSPSFRGFFDPGLYFCFDCEAKRNLVEISPSSEYREQLFIPFFILQLHKDAVQAQQQAQRLFDTFFKGWWEHIMHTRMALLTERFQDRGLYGYLIRVTISASDDDMETIAALDIWYREGEASR